MIPTLAFLFVRLAIAYPASNAEAMNNLGAHYYEQGRYRDAEPLFRGALELLPADDRLAGIISNNLAALFGAEGRFREAHAALAVPPPESKEYAISVCNLGELYRKEGRFADGESNGRRGLGLLDKADPHYADCLETMALIDRATGHAPEAGEYLAQALAIREKAQPSSIAVGVTLNNLGSFYISQRRFSEAEAAERRSVAILTKAAGPDHPALAASLNGLAQTLRLSSRYVEVEPLYRRALAIFAKSLGESHPDYARTLGNLADYYFEQRRNAEAVALYTRSVSILAAALGPAAPELTSQRDRLEVADAAVHHRHAKANRKVTQDAFAARATHNVATP